MPIPVTLPARLQAVFNAQAGDAFPQEACGLLVGHWQPDRLVVTGFEPSPNRAEKPGDGFEIDTGLQATLQRSLRTTEDQIIGVWHSHPSGDPSPSDIDSLAAFDPDFLWVITSAGSQENATSFHLAPLEQGNAFRPVLAVIWA